MLDVGEYSPSEVLTAECVASFNTLLKKTGKNKRRFSDEQIRSLETMFESESKLEPRKKLQVARELGLQPRQVAIWFQNKRARWKSKQLERDYSVLRANYNTLASQFETLKKEKQSLITQLQKLNDLTEKSQGGTQCCRKGVAKNSSDNQSNNGDGKSEFELKPPPIERSEPEVCVLPNKDGSGKAEYFGLDEEPDLLNMVEPADGSLTSPENWGSLDSNEIYDQSNNSNQWWDFWS